MMDPCRYETFKKMLLYLGRLLDIKRPTIKPEHYQMYYHQRVLAILTNFRFPEIKTTVVNMPKINQ